MEVWFALPWEYQLTLLVKELSFVQEMFAKLMRAE